MTKQFNFCTACGGHLEQHYTDPDNKISPYYRCESCSLPQYNSPTVGVAVIHIQGGRILLGKRKSSYRDNLWCIPCGHLDAYESAEDGAKREFLEETSLQAHDLELFNVRTNPNNTVGIYFTTKKVTGPLQAGDDLSELRYFKMDDLPNMAFVSDLVMIDQLKGEPHGR